MSVKSTTIRNAYIYSSAIFSGFAVMILEILSSRLLAPHFGSGIYVWASIISVTLFSLSLGYYFAGKIADKIVSLRSIGMVLMLSGICTLTSIKVFPKIVSLISDIDLRLSALISSIFLVFFPIMLLGTTSILASKILYQYSNKFSSSVGRILALSTIAGIFGALLSGFYLVSIIGSTKSLIILAWLLLLLGIWGMSISKRTMLYLIFMGSMLLYSASISYFAISSNVPITGYKIIERKESPFGEILVLEDGFRRYLFVDRILQTQEPKLLDLFWEKGMLLLEGNYLELIPYLNKEGESCLIIGLGGGLIAKIFRYYDWQVEAVEIDPVITEIAKKYFNYEEEIKVADGRYFLENAKNRKWDVIILDVFLGESVPTHLYTYEMFKTCSNRLTTNGILALNYIGSSGSILTESLFYTLKQVFSNVVIYPHEYKFEGVQFLYVFASNSSLNFPSRVDFENSTIIDLQKPISDIAINGKAIILTDYRNPIDVFRANTAQIWRNISKKRFGF